MFDFYSEFGTEVSIYTASRDLENVARHEASAVPPQRRSRCDSIASPSIKDRSIRMSEVSELIGCIHPEDWKRVGCLCFARLLNFSLRVLSATSKTLKPPHHQHGGCLTMEGRRTLSGSNVEAAIFIISRRAQPSLRLFFSCHPFVQPDPSHRRGVFAGHPHQLFISQSA